MKKTLVVLSISVVLINCGTGSGTFTSGFFPTIEFELPDIVISSSSVNINTISDARNVLSKWAFRIDRIIDRLNQISTRLNQSVETTGSFSVFLSTGTVTGVVSELTDDSTYKYQAVACLNDAPFLQMKWNEAQTKIYSLKDHSIDVMDHGNSTLLRTEITYDGSSSTTIVTFNAYGTPWHVPTGVSNDLINGGTYLGEYVYATKGSDGSFTMKGVNAWETEERTESNASDPFDGDIYMTGELNSDGSGNFIGYRIFNSTICGTFDDTNLDDPGWCFSGTVNTLGVVIFDIYTYDTQWTTATLKPIGIANDSSINVVDDLSSLSCTD